ncbi:MAG: DHH family phosphoesterase [Synergistaceae bacterium]
MCEQLAKLKQYFMNKEEPPSLGIIIHSNPDPDCIGAAKGFEKIIKTWSPESQISIIYDGEISHPQNKTMVKVLNINLIHRDDAGRKPEDLKEFADMFVVIDVMPERCELGKIKPIMVIDHHPVDTKNAELKDIRQVGSCCTIIWEYLNKEGIQFEEKSDDDANIATAMLVGLKTDTMDLISEKVTDLDFEAFKHLLGNSNRTKLASITHYPIPPYLFGLRSRLEDPLNCMSENGLYIGGIGYLSPNKRDALPTIAEERARTEGIDTAFIFGVVGDKIEVCIRSNSPSVDVKHLCHQIFGKEHGGGHPRAGAVQIPMGFLSIEDADENMQEKMWASVRDFIMSKIKSEMNLQR